MDKEKLIVHFDKNGVPLAIEGVNELCKTCKNNCKQCASVKIVNCPLYEKKEGDG